MLRILCAVRRWMRSCRKRLPGVCARLTARLTARLRMLRILCAVRSCRKPAACAPDGAPCGAFENAAHSLRGARWMRSCRLPGVCARLTARLAAARLTARLRMLRILCAVRRWMRSCRKRLPGVCARLTARLGARLRMLRMLYVIRLARTGGGSETQAQGEGGDCPALHAELVRQGLFVRVVVAELFESSA